METKTDAPFNTKEQIERKSNKFVPMKCGGIVERTGFYAYPEADSPVYVEFWPKEVAQVEEAAAKYLLAQDSTRFSIVEEKTEEKKEAGGESAVAASTTTTATDATAKPADKKPKKRG